MSIRRLLRSLASRKGQWSAEDPRRFWEWRARKYGARAVLNLSHSDEEFEQFTEAQWATLLTYFQDALDDLGEPPQRVLDFGCGPGRFTPRLAALTGANVVGVDISETLLRLAPANASCTYRVIEPHAALPFPGGTFDVIWAVLVLGGITTDDAVEATARELIRCLRPGGVLFLAENTTQRPGANHWRPRRVTAYEDLFKPLRLSRRGDYSDLDETISVFVGRKSSE